MGERFQLSDVSTVARESDALQGVVAVLRYSGGDDSVVLGLQRLVTRLGGKVHANPTDATTHIINADPGPGPQLRCWLDKARRDGAAYDVVDVAWLRECEKNGRRVGLEPRFVLYASEKSRETMEEQMDAWGDRYKEEATLQSLSTAMQLAKNSGGRGQPMAGTGGTAVEAGGEGGSWEAQMRSRQPREELLASHLQQLRDDDLAALQTKRAACPLSRGRIPNCGRLRCHPAYRYSMFRGIVAYAPQPSTQLRLRMGGASLELSPSAAVTHVILPASAASDGRLTSLRAKILEDQVKLAGITPLCRVAVAVGFSGKGWGWG